MTSNKPNILIIDDDPTLTSAIKLVLENEGYNLEAASDSSIALEKVGAKNFDILLVDYNLPDMNGLDLIKNAIDVSPRSVPVLITGVSSMDLAFDGMRLGVHDYLVKPIDYDELKKIIKSILDERKHFDKGKERLQRLENQNLEAGNAVLTPKSEKKRHDETEEMPLSGSVFEKSGNPLEDDLSIEEYRKEIASIGESESESESEAAPEEEKERTIFDFVLDRSSKIRKNIERIAAGMIVFGVLFITIDTLYLQFTPVGKNLHSKFWPPAIVLDSIPSGALVSLKDSEGNQIVEGNNYTPIAIPKIMPGSYDLKMTEAGYNPIERKITVYAKDKKKSEVTIPGSVQKSDGEERTQKFILSFETTVEIGSYPEKAAVYVDGVKMGSKTPLSVNLTAGPHTVMLEKDGFPSLGNLERFETYGKCNLDLSKKEQDDVDTRYWIIEKNKNGFLIKGTFWSEISVDSRPSGAQLYMDGELLGVTPSNIRLVVGKHNVKLGKNGYLDWNKEIDIPGEDVYIARLLKTVQFVAYDIDAPGKDIKAAVSISGNAVKGRQTPFYYSFERATYKITFSKSDYVKWSKNIEIDKQDKIIAEMKKVQYPVTIKAAEADTLVPVGNALIRIDGLDAGKTDEKGLLGVNLISGSHKIEVKREDYIDKSVTKRVSSEIKEIDIFMEPEPVPDDGLVIDEKTGEIATTATVIIDTRPHFPGASIYFDNKFEGETLRRIGDVEMGRHKVTIKHPYIGKVTDQISLDEPGKKVIVNFTITGEVKIK